jgi:hypothetical protein
MRHFVILERRNKPLAMRRLLLRGLTGGIAAVASLVTSPSFAAVSFGPETDLVQAGGLYAGGHADSAPTVATDGTNYLVAWSDVSGIECVRCVATNSFPDILDQPPMRLALTGTSPTVLWDGTEYIVVAGQVGQRVNPSTAPLSAPFPLQGVSGTDTRFAFGGGALLAVWTDSSGALTGALLDKGGTLLAGGVTLGSGPVIDWSLASSGTNFLVAWTTSEGTVGGARVSLAGALLDPTPLVIDPGQAIVDAGALADSGEAGASRAPTANVTVAAYSGGYLVSWIDGRAGSSEIFSAQIGVDGQIMDPGGLGIAEFGACLDCAPPVTTWEGSGWWILNVTSDPNGLGLGIFLPPSGGEPRSGSVNAPVPSALAANANGGLAARAVPDGVGGTAIEGALVLALGNLAPDARHTFPLSLYPAPQDPLCAAASATGYAVVWREFSSLFAGRLGHDGTPIDKTALSLEAPGFSRGWPAPCAVLADQFLVAVGGDVYTLATDGIGTYPSPLGITATDAGAAFDGNSIALGLACMADRCLLVWVGKNAATASATIVDPTGKMMVPPFDVPFDVATALSTGVFPPVKVATDGASFVIAEDGQVLAVAADGTHGSFVSGGDGNVASLAGSGGIFLLGGAQSSTLDWLNSAGHAQASPEPLPLPAPSGESIAVAWDGTGFFVAQAALDSGAPAVVGMEVTVPAAPVDGGTPMPGAGPSTFPLFPSASSVVAASYGTGEVLVVSAQPRGTYWTPRLVARIGTTITDAGMPNTSDDAGFSDASLPDATVPDASSPDASLSDATVPDAAPPSITDAATPVTDGGSNEAPTTAGGGCTCTTSGAKYAPGPWWLALVPLHTLRRRARRRLQQQLDQRRLPPAPSV